MSKSRGTVCSLIVLTILALSISPAFADLHPYTGDSIPGVDRTTLTGKIMCGYQGWFTTPTDGANRGWTHYASHGKFEPGYCCIDLWPDVTELDADEKYSTPFKLADGSAASVFSSHNPKTVLRHFKWMQQYGIDGVFMQRFVNETIDPRSLAHCNIVLDNCRSAANQTGRAYAVMYDLSGMRGSAGADHLIEDWKSLVDQMHLGRDGRDKAYLHHRGHPVVAVWGIGFSDHRPYTLADSAKVIDFLKEDPRYGHNTIMIGVPSGWRTRSGDAVDDPALFDLLEKTDIISPWTVGRFSSPEGAKRHADLRWTPDVAWCGQHGKDYLPVVFPGFSWHNMHTVPGDSVDPSRKHQTAPLDQIPRLKGQFQWTQYVGAKHSGATMVYQAMFDEMDEGTAIFKCTNDPPAGTFVTFEGLPTDHYLWLAGMGGKLIRGEIAATEKIPSRR